MGVNTTFDVPPYDTRDDIGELGFGYAFTVTLEYGEGAQITETARGERVYKAITGGTVSGRIKGDVYPQGAGEYSLRRADGVTDLRGQVLIKAETGEWVHLQNMGYDRPGYFRTLAWVDADTRGSYTWTQGLFFIGVGEPAADGKSIAITYYEAL